MDIEQRQRVMDEFDRQHGIPDGVSITAVEIPFWNMVNLFLKAYAALLVASAIIGACVGIVLLIWMLITS